MSEENPTDNAVFPQAVFDQYGGDAPRSVESPQQTFIAGTKQEQEQELPQASGENPPTDDVLALWLMVDRADRGITDGEAAAGFIFYGKTLYLHNFRSRLTELRKEFRQPGVDISTIFDFRYEKTLRGRGGMKRHFLTPRGRRKALAWLHVKFTEYYHSK